MKNLRKKLLALTFILTIVGSMQAKNALIVIAHGSPMPSWRKPVLDLEPIVRQKLATHPVKGIDYMRLFETRSRYHLCVTFVHSPIKSHGRRFTQYSWHEV